MWVITLVCEELRQLFVIRAPSARNAVAIYFKSYWNKLDVVAIILFFVGKKRKLLDEPDLDEERVQSLQENILNRIRRLENHMRLISNQQAIMCDYLEHLMDDSKTNNDKRIKLPERHLLDPE
ncbi:unnamed protein product [Rotaria sordida]|uniref:Uncharacterized protein n=1 Tax=Rotaria sordida TaxID=392033 RepID=A0A815SLE5_9BILA|nr:unnamed protein product [Rotaria sordida]CAF1257154.1 unnamed protein product [Rotaria sordida]CAF1493018.1 unnamed protein product [Rotaria sordida]